MIKSNANGFENEMRKLCSDLSIDFPIKYDFSIETLIVFENLFANVLAHHVIFHN